MSIWLVASKYLRSRAQLNDCMKNISSLVVYVFLYGCAQSEASEVTPLAKNAKKEKTIKQVRVASKDFIDQQKI